MKLRIGLVAAAILAAPLAGHAQGSVERDLSFSRTRAATITATVKKIDQKTREVTVVGESGKPVTFTAGEEVKNLAQIKKGDVVTVEYFDSVVIDVSKPTKNAPESTATAAVARAKPGEQPGAAGGAEVTLVATITAIAPDKGSVTLKTKDGKTETLPVKNPENLTGVRVGDQVVISATKAVAVSVAPSKEPEKAEKKKK